MTFLVFLLGVPLGAVLGAEDPNLVGWWTLDDGSGSVAKDSSGNGRDGTLLGAPQWIAGKIGAGALSFDGVDDVVQVADAPALALSNALTLSAWVKLNNFSTYYFIVDKQPSGTAGTNYPGNYEFRTTPAGLVQFGHQTSQGTDFTFYDSASGLTAGRWTHVVVTVVKAGQVKFYIDGTPAGSVAQSMNFPVLNNEPVRIGGRKDGYSFFNGCLDDVRIYNRALTVDAIKDVMVGLAKLATNPNPAHGAVDVPRDASLGWIAGKLPATHDVYLGKTLADVSNASRAKTAGVLASQGQTATTYTPTALLEYGQTYYWRIDEVNTSPDGTIYQGNVWSFTAEPYGYPITGVTATASSSAASMGPEKTIDGSGLTGDLHGTEGTTMWLSGGAKPNWIQYQFDKVYKLYDLKVWNSNQLIETFLGFGAKNVTIETSTDGTAWTALANVPEFAKATGLPGYAANTTVNLGGVMAQYVKLTITSNWGGMALQTGLSEVRFSYIPVQAFAPQPANAATGVTIDTTLNWWPGREAGSHQVFFGTDPNAVANGTVAGKTVTDHAFTPGTLNLGTTYYWKVDEVNTVTYPGDVWSFTTQEFAAVDDFESYNDDDNRLYDAWIDGYTDGKSGSIVGNMTAPFAEQTIIHGGKQAMPFEYNNVKAPYYSEASRTFDVTQNWTTNGADTLSLYFRGRAAGFADNGNGTFSMSSSGTDVWNNGDQFRFAYKSLNGDGSIVARVDSIANTNVWAKGGVMIRQSIDTGSTHAFMPITAGGSGAGNGASFQRRLTAAGASTNDDNAAPVVAAPYWVKVERKGNSFTGSISPDGKTWTPLGTAQTITMTNPVLIGLALCSHDVALTTVAEFSNVSTTGTVTGSWQDLAIGMAMPTNGAAPLYLTVQDKAGKTKMVVNPNPSASATAAWTEWRIPLSDLTGLNLTAVQKITLGVGDKASPKAGPAGMLYFDDIGYGHPVK
jgi:hypothetical protein